MWKPQVNIEYFPQSLSSPHWWPRQAFSPNLEFTNLLEGMVNNPRGWSCLLLPEAEITGTRCWSLPWEMESKLMLTWWVFYDSCLFRSRILWRSNINIPWVHTLPSRKKYSELVGGSQEYGQKEKKIISLVKGLLSCSSRVPSGFKSPQSYLHMYSLGGVLPSSTLSTTSPVHIPQCTLVVKYIPACIP